MKTSFARQDITDAQWGLNGASWITSTLNIASGTEAEMDTLYTYTLYLIAKGHQGRASWGVDPEGLTSVEHFPFEDQLQLCVLGPC